MGNIDQNPTNTTAITSIHGTSMSLFQYPTQVNEGEKREPFQIRDLSVKKKFRNIPKSLQTSARLRLQAKIIHLRGRNIPQTAFSFCKLLKEAYSYYCNNNVGVQQAALSFEGWYEKRKEDSLQFTFWYLVQSMELTTLTLVRAFREAIFVLYCQALSALIPCFFANNNTN